MRRATRTPQTDASTPVTHTSDCAKPRSAMTFPSLFCRLPVSYPFQSSSRTAGLFCSALPPPGLVSSLQAASHPPRCAASRGAPLYPFLQVISRDQAASLRVQTPATHVLLPIQKRIAAHSNQTPASSRDSHIPRSPAPTSSPASAL